MDDVYEASLFEELKKDIADLKADTQTLRSITLGINLNPSFEVESIGLISVNSKEFKSSGILSNFADTLLSRSEIQDGNEWKENYRFTPVSKNTGELTTFLGNFGEYFAMMRQPLFLFLPTGYREPNGHSQNRACGTFLLLINVGSCSFAATVKKCKPHVFQASLRHTA